MKKKLSPKMRIPLAILTFTLPFLVVWTVWGNTALMVSRITISSSRIPPGFSGFRIAQVSDLHNAEFGNRNSKLLQIISDAAPDTIVITGDLVDASHTNIDIAVDFAKAATQIAPVYYVTGNHEAALPQYNALKTALESANVIILEDTVIQLECNGDTLTFIGLSDPNFTSRSDVSSMVETKLNALSLDDSCYTILLSHRPELFDAYVSSGIDLIFSGHAHGGQFRLPLIGGLIAPNQGFFPKYDAGLYSEGKTNMVVSRGIGNSIIPLRFNNRPEVVLVELNREP